MLPIPIGVSDFLELRSEGYAYIDKSLLIVEVLNHSSKVLLLPRPRRFGKTLNLSMLAHFFGLQVKSRKLFEGLAVEQFPEIMAKQGAFPTVMISFKDLKSTSWEDCQEILKRFISSIFLNEKKWLELAPLEGPEARDMEDLIQRKGPLSLYEDGLLLLTKLLQRASGKRVVLLIDEYDTPIHAGYQNGYFREVVSFMRNFLGAGFKDNIALEKGVLTGILRVARESIFSGLNNLDVYTLLSESFSTHFGFTQHEVDELLAASGCDLADIRDWYNGYRFGSSVIYNPWSILKVALNPKEPLQAHWVNTSGNELIRELITDGAMSVHQLDELLFGEGIVHKVDSSVELERQKPDSVWDLLLFSGYLTTVELGLDGVPLKCRLRIPNLEVRSFFEDTIRDWIRAQTGGGGLRELFDALRQERLEAVEGIFSALVIQVLSHHDVGGKQPERVYHAFLLGLLMDWREHYEIKSNRESGWGRYDLALFPKQPGNKGYLFAFKRGDELVKAACEALTQIESRAYFIAFEERGVQKALLISVGLNGKGCRIRSRNWLADTGA